jgi:hypothetical protein
MDTEHQLIFRALHGALEQMEVDSSDHLRENLDAALQPRLAALLHDGEPGSADETKAADELIRAVLRLRRRLVLHWLRELRFLAEDAREQGDVRAEAYQQDISTHASQLAKIDRALVGARQRRPAAPTRLGVK